VCESIEAPKVLTDDGDSSFKATEHLIKNGCKRIAHLSISNDLSISKERLRGYTDALKKHNIEQEDEIILECDGDDPASYKQITDLLNSKNPDSIFASVEKLAITSYYVCEELQLKIPEDIKVIGFSNLEMASLLNPSLTTITEPAYEIGRNAATFCLNV
jgi:LacI family transcriptional regulator